MALITFDLDGVLQRNPFRTGVFPHIWRELTPAYLTRHPGTPEEEVRRGIRAMIQMEFRRRQEAGDWVGTYDWDSIIATVGRELGYTGAPMAVAALVRHYCTPEHVAALPGAHTCLAALRAAGHTLKVLTNGFATYQEPVLETLGLTGFFASILTPDRCGSAKPQPDFFAAAGPPPALHVGDTLVHDICGARAAGFTAVWLPPDLPAALQDISPEQRARDPRLLPYIADRLAFEANWYPEPRPAPREVVPDFVVRDLTEVPAVVAAWTGT